MDRKQLKHRAFDTWNIDQETLEQVEARIHDGASMSQLAGRANGYLKTFEKFFPGTSPTRNTSIMEIGSGVGYVMEAALKRYDPSRLIGLDVAPGMIDKAKERFSRDKIDCERIEFVQYDGIDIPFEDNTIDFVYSVASMQHVPRHFFFQVLLETQRVLAPGGRAWIHLLSISHFKKHVTKQLFASEVRQQVNNLPGHWHHYYASEELEHILHQGIEASEIAIREHDGSLYITFTKNQR